MRGRHLKRLRERAGLDKKETIERLGIGRSTLNAYECGLRKPRPHIAHRMTQVYGCTFDEIFAPYAGDSTKRSHEATA